MSSKCLAAVTVRRRVTAGDVSAGQADPQVHPVRPGQAALRAAVLLAVLGMASRGEVLAVDHRRFPLIPWNSRLAAIRLRPHDEPDATRRPSADGEQAGKAATGRRGYAVERE